MGKLLQKLVNGIVPSWLSKVKSSANTSPKKLLPFFKGSTHSSSISPSSSARNNTEVLPLAPYDNTDQSIEDDEEPCSKACAESSVQKGKTASMKQKAHKNDEKHHHHHQDHNESHDPHHVDVKTYSNQGMHEHGTDTCAPSGTPSSREQGTPSVRKDEHDHRPQQHHGNHNNHLGLDKRNQCSPEADHHHHQEAQSGRHNADHVEFCNTDFLELDGEVNVCKQEDNHHNYHDKEQSHYEAEIGYEHYKNVYQDLLGLKRKSQYLQEEDGEEEAEGGSHRSGNIDTTVWGWKRTKGERGVMSCELPESICCIVGNGKAVVKHSKDPHMALWESMVEMIVGNGIWELGNLEFLLFCYLSLNEPHLHPIIQSSFLRVLKDLEKTVC